jgi:hypothetical protein
LSIETLVRQFQITLHIYRPVLTVSTDGKPMRTYTFKETVYGFIQPSSQSSEVFEGRSNGRTSGTIYFVGATDVAIDDEIYSAKTGTALRWRVSGLVNPGEIARIFPASHRLNMTVVDVVEIAPEQAAP